MDTLYHNCISQSAAMKFVLKIIATITATILIAGTVVYFALTPSENTAALKQTATDPLWPQRSSPGSILLKGVAIVDTKSGDLSTDMDILVVGGRIRTIMQTGAIPVLPDVRVIEAYGKYVVPGFVNMHMHVIDYPNPSKNLAIMLTHGITGFRQMSGSPELLKLRKVHGLPMQDQQPALLAMPGSVLTPVNTHNIKAAQKNVRQQKADGADFIKIGMLLPDVFFATISEAKRIGIPVLGHVMSDANMMAVSDSGFMSVEHLGLNYGGLTVCSTQEEALRNLGPQQPKVLSYLPGFMDKLSMKLLQNTLINPAVGTSEKEYERINRIVRTFSEAIARKNAMQYLANKTWQCPTMSHLRGYQLAFLPEVKNEPGYWYDDKKKEEKHREITAKFEKELTPLRKEILIRAYNLQLKLVKIYDTVGLKFLAGTDDHNGNGLQLEFEEFAKAGLSPLHILQTATINAAEFLDRTADIGTVEQGKIADLLLLDSNPLEDVHHLRQINAVMRSGYYFNKSDLVALKTKALQKQK